MRIRVPRVANRIFKNTTLAAASSAFYYVVYWLMLVFVSRVGGPTELGRMAIAMAIVTPITLFCNLSLRQVQVIDLHSRNTSGEYFLVRLVTSIVQLVLIGGMVVLVRYPNPTAFVIAMFMVAKTIEGFSDFCYGVFQRLERFDLIARSMIARSLVGGSAFVLVYWLERNLSESIMAMCVAWFAIYYVHDWVATRKLADPEHTLTVSNMLHTKVDRYRQMISLVLSALPLASAQLLVSVNENIPRYLLSAFSGEATLGIFTSMAYLVIMGSIVFISLGQAMTPPLVQAASHKEWRKVVDLVGVLCVAAALLGMGGILFAAVFGEQFLRMAYGASFAEKSGAFIWIMLAGATAYLASAFGFSATALQVFRPQPFAIFLAILANVALGRSLVSGYGIVGVSVGWITSNCVTAILLCAVVFLNLRTAFRRVKSRAKPLDGSSTAPGT